MLKTKGKKAAHDVTQASVAFVYLISIAIITGIRRAIIHCRIISIQ